MKDFTAINTERIYGDAESAAGKPQQQSTASPEEQASRAAELRTQGRKGCKSVRINMAFSSANYSFIKIVSRVTGQNMTQLTNAIIDQYRAEHPDVYEEAKALLEKIQA